MKKKISGMILSLENECAVVLTPDGQFIKTAVKMGTHFVGDEITFTINEDNLLIERWKDFNLRGKGISLKRPILQAVFSICMIAVAGVGSWAYPTGHVYMDVNPSLGLSYNVYHRVIGVESFNEDGAKVLNQISVYGNTLAEGLEKTLKVMDQQGFIKEKEEGVSGVLLGFTDPNLEKEMVSSVVRTSETLHKTVQVATVAVAPVSEEIAKEQKGQADTLSPIEAEIAGQKIEKSSDVKDKVKKDKNQIKAEIKALGKKIKEEKAKQLKDEKDRQIKDNQFKEKPENTEKPLKPENTEKPKKQQKREIQRKTEKPIEKVIETTPTLETSPKQEVKDKPKEEGLEGRIQKIDKEIAELTVLLETLQEEDGKDKQKENKIKKIIKRIERLTQEKIKLEKK